MAKKASAASKGKSRQQPELPPVQVVTLYWIDERVKVPARKRINPNYPRSEKFELNCARGTVFQPGTASFETRDIDKAIAWCRARLREGWINEADLKERQTLMRIFSKAANKSGEYVPGVKKSGKGMKGSRKPQRDYTKVSCHGGHNG